MTLETTRALILRQISRLERVRERGYSEEASMAHRLLKGFRVELHQLQTCPGTWRLVMGAIGENGGPLSTYAVDDVCRRTERHPCLTTNFDGITPSVGQAESLRALNREFA